MRYLHILTEFGHEKIKKKQKNCKKIKMKAEFKMVAKLILSRMYFFFNFLKIYLFQLITYRIYLKLFFSQKFKMV
jgi:hypothetical protein